ncbi:hypothetical protein BC940DRAFT_294374 [Gongronella butleri]|nr:hypothetical protein BC940DRAFT_294374 [Gongronella butleri]
MDPAYIQERCSLIPNNPTHEIQRFKNHLIDIAFLYARFRNFNITLALDKLRGEMNAFSEEQQPAKLGLDGISYPLLVGFFWSMFVYINIWTAAIFGALLLLLNLAKIGYDMYAKQQHTLAQQSIKDLTNLCDGFYFAIEQECPMPTSSNAPKNDATEESLPSYTPEQ